jgi:uncharacterized membrane protein HdeD (DUF308 family)
MFCWVHGETFAESIGTGEEAKSGAPAAPRFRFSRRGGTSSRTECSHALDCDFLANAESWSCPVSSTKVLAIVSVLLGVAAIVLPYFFGTLAVMMLGGVMLASGVVGLLFVNDARRQGVPVSVFGPWAQVLLGAVILIWPELALWVVAVLLGGGLILSGITGLTALRDAGVVNPPLLRKIGLWASIVLGALLIVMGAFGSAILLGMFLGIALINAGLQQWREADLVL